MLLFILHVSFFCKGLLHAYEGSMVELPLTRTPVIQIANYSYRLGSSGKHFLAVFVLHLFYGLNVSPICQIHVNNFVIMFYLYVNKYEA